MSRVSAVTDRAKGFMSGFTSGQRSVVIVVGLALVLGAFALTRWIAQPSYTLLYGNLSGTDANAIVQQLTSDGVKYKLSAGGAAIMVPADQVDNLRVTLSGAGLPAGDDGGGWSLLDKQGITATDFQQNVAYQRALEGELGKTLEAMTGVNTAVVHLAIPAKDVFSTTTDQTTASVLLNLAPGTTLSGDQIQSITHLVSGSVSGLDPTNVTVTDQNGQLLSSAGGGGSGSSSSQDEQTASYEDRLAKAAQGVLDSVVGAGNAVVRVNAQLNFDSTETTSQTYTQPTPVPSPLSAATVQENYGGGSSSGASGGTLGQIIPSPAVSGASGSGSGAYSRSQSTVNNPIDSSVSKTTSAPGAVQRLTVAVVLNSKTAGSLNTTQIQQLVANSVGLNPARGDLVQVQALPFDGTAAAAAKAQIAAADKAAKLSSYTDLAKKAGLGLLVLIVLIMLLRGRKKDAEEQARIEATASDLPNGMLVSSSPMALESGQQLAIGAQAAGQAHEEMRDEVSALVDNQPEDVAQMLQGWLAGGK